MDLGKIANCPNERPEGMGKTWLEECADEAKDSGRSIEETADSLVPIYTRDLWEIWTDCGGYYFDGSFRDFGRASDDGDRMNRIAQADCYEWALNLTRYIRGE